MDPPRFLLEALEESITSGTFIDTKFYVFSRRDSSGRIGSPRPLYCNSRVLNTVPYFSSLFSSDGFAEGQMTDINKGFPPDEPPYTESYDYLSDSDLEDDEPEKPRSGQVPDQQITPGNAADNLPQPPQDASEVENHNPADNGFVRAGKVAVIKDMAAVTFEAMIYYLCTGEVTFTSPSSDPRSEVAVPPEARTGDWKAARTPRPSAKSMYRLADKYDIPELKERAKACIYASLEYYDILDEVFSCFSSSFPEILPLQVSKLVGTIKEEAKGDTGSDTMKRLLDKIASSSQSQLTRARDALVMIWSGILEQLDLSLPKPASTLPASSSLFPNWNRVKLAILKSISTGTFIDIQYYAYTAICNNFPLDPKPLFTSSIVIEEWESAISTQTAGADSQVVCPADELTDDYECRHGVPSGTLPEDKVVLKYWSEARKSHQAVILVSGARKTWTSLLSYAYTNRMNFAPLQTATHDSGLVVDAGAQPRPYCSPRSMYSLSTAIGIKNIKEDALKDLRSKLTTSNIVQELFTSFAANYKEVMDMEIGIFLDNFTEEDPELLMDHVQRMSSGEAPFFPTTLSLLYGKLVEKAAPLKCRLICPRCSNSASVEELSGYLSCPGCPRGPKRKLDKRKVKQKLPPCMECAICNTPRTAPSNSCAEITCRAIFV